MSPTRVKRGGEGDSTPQLPQSTPHSVGLGSPDHSFTLQTIMELQKSIGQMNATMEGMRQSIDGMKGKVDDLVGWKNKIIGGVAVLGLVFAFIGFVIGKASDYVTLKQPTPAVVPAPTVGAPIVVTPSPAKP